MKIEVKEFEVPDGVITNFWCSECDAQTVKSQDKTSGRFFIQAGHVWNGIQASSPIGSYYPLIIWALCNTCLEKDK